MTAPDSPPAFTPDSPDVQVPPASETVPGATSAAEIAAMLGKREQERLERLAAFAGALAALPEEALRYQPPKSEPKEPTVYPHASKWGQAALNGQSFEMETPGHWPSSKRDMRRAHKMYETKKHLGTLNAALSVDEEGIYKIGPDGKSRLRINGSLKHLNRKQRRSIQKAEKNYLKSLGKQQRARHALEHSG